MIRLTWCGATPAFSRTSAMPRTTPSSGAAGVVSTFPEKNPFGVSRTTSVKVPPISTASRQPCIISEFPKDFPDTNKPVTRTAHLVFGQAQTTPARVLIPGAWCNYGLVLHIEGREPDGSRRVESQ